MKTTTIEFQLIVFPTQEKVLSMYSVFTFHVDSIDSISGDAVLN